MHQRTDTLKRSDLLLRYVSNDSYSSSNYYVLTDVTNRYIIHENESNKIDRRLLNQLFTENTSRDSNVDSILIKNSKIINVFCPYSNNSNTTLEHLTRVSILNSNHSNFSNHNLSNKELVEQYNSITDSEVESHISNITNDSELNSSSNNSYFDLELFLESQGISKHKDLLAVLNASYYVRNISNLRSLSRNEIRNACSSVFVEGEEVDALIQKLDALNNRI